MRTLITAAASAACLFGLAHAAPVTVDFDGLTAGDTVETVGVLTISSDTGFPLVIGTGLETTSGANYLAVGDGTAGGGPFLSGDAITFSFAEAITSFSLNAITTAAFPAGALTLSGGTQSVQNGAPDQVLSFGDEVFMLMLSFADPVTSVTLSAAEGGVFAFGLDDVGFDTVDAIDPVPLPGALFLFAPALGLLAARRRR